MDGKLSGMTGNLRRVRIALALSVLTILYGFVLGGAFGAFEERIKSHFREGAVASATLDPGRSEEDAERLAGRAWVLLKRAHLHANGLGTAALVMTLLLTVGLNRQQAVRWIGLALGVGALGYSSFWMFAAMRAPALGSTGAAKSSLEWLALPSAALLLVGAAATLFLILFGRLGRG